MYLAEECSKIVFDAVEYRWSYQHTLCGNILMYAGVLVTIVIISAMGCLDIVAYLKYLSRRKVSKKLFDMRVKQGFDCSS